jgi:hypothetical protein
MLKRDDGLNDGESGSYGTFRIIFTRLRVAEVDKQSVTLVAGNEPVETLYGLYYRRAKSIEQIPILFHVHALAEFN